MSQVVTVAVGIGLVLSLIFSEFFSLVAGGMVVPGYLAMAMDNPISIVSTVVVAMATWLVVSALAQYIIIYGRRRTVLMILFGFIFNLLAARYADIEVPTGEISLEAVGHIIPGLIAIWFDRQGPLSTIAAMTIGMVIVRLGLILIYGAELML